MTKAIPMYKRVGAVLLSLSLLCGVIMSTGAFSAMATGGEQSATATPPMNWTFDPDFSGTVGSASTYDFSADTAANNAIRDAIDAKFNVYSGRESWYAKIDKAELGADNDDGNNWSSSENRVKAFADGLVLYANIGSYDNNTTRNYMSLVPKDASGNEIATKNFEVSFDLKTQLLWSNGGFMLTFRSKDNGRVAVSQPNPYTQRAAVIISADGVGILDGSETAPAYAEALYNKPFDAANDGVIYDKFPSGYDSGNGHGHSPLLHVTVKVVGDKVKVTLVRDGETEAFVDVEKTITWAELGGISFSGLVGENYVSNISLTVLDENGKGPKEDYFTYRVDRSETGITTWPYDFSADNAVNNAIRDEIDAKFNVYSGRESWYAKIDKAELGADNDNGNAWSNSENRVKASANGLVLYAHVDAFDTRTTRNYMSLVPKDKDGNEIALSDFEVSFDLKTQLSWSHGGFMLTFRSKETGRLATGEPNPYTQRAAVLIGADGVGVLDGSETAPAYAEALWKKPFAAANNGVIFDKFPTGYDTGNANGYSPLMHVTVKVEGDKVKVTLTKDGEAEAFVDVEKTITWAEEGGISFSGLFGENYISNIVLNPLTEDEGEGEGEGTVPAAPDFEFKPDFSVASAGNYDFSADNAANNAIRDEIDAKFNVYAGREGTYFQKVNKAELGADNDGGNDWSSSETRLKANANGLAIYNNLGDYGDRTTRNYMSLVPKDASGNEIAFKNFEVSFDLTTELKWSNGGFMLTFRSLENGRVATGEPVPYTQRAAVIIGADGVGVLDGSLTAPAYAEALWTAPFAEANNGVIYDKFPSGYDTGNGHGTSFLMHVTVKVVGDKVKVALVRDGETEAFVDVEKTITWAEEGGISFSGLLGENAISNIELNELDENGNRPGQEPPADAPDWTYSADRSSTGITTWPYDFSADNATNNAIRDEIDAKFNVYSGREAWYAKVDKAELGADNDNGNTWSGSENRIKATADGLMLYTHIDAFDNKTTRNYMSLVPKDAEGNELSAKNFEVSFDLKTQLLWSNGGFMLTFRSLENGRIATGEPVPYTQRAAVIIGADGVGVLDGSLAAPAYAEALHTKPFDAANDGVIYDKFPTGYDTGNGHGTSFLMHVTVKVVGDKVKVALVRDGETEAFVDVEKTITWAEEGGISFSGLLGENYISNIELKLLDDSGNQGGEGGDTPPVATPDWTYSADRTADGITGSYDFSADNATNNAIRDEIDAKFNVYAGREGTYFQKVDKADLGADNDGNNSWNESETRLKATRYGLSIYNHLGAFDGFTMRNYMSLVPKDAQGVELSAKNFEMTFDLTTQLLWSNGGFMLTFRSLENGRLATGDAELYTQRAAVLIGADGVGVLDGSLAAPDYAANLWAKPFDGTQNGSLYDKFPSGYDTGNGNGSSPLLHVYVKVLNNTVTVQLTKDGEQEPFVNVEKIIKWTEKGGISFSGLLGENQVGNIEITLLADDATGGESGGQGGGEGGGEEDDDKVIIEQPDTENYWSYRPDFSVLNVTTQWPYKFATDLDENNMIRDSIYSKFNIYHAYDTNVILLSNAQIGTMVNDSWNGSGIQLKVVKNGLNLYTQMSDWDGHSMRNTLSAVPKNANGEELKAKNFEASFTLTSKMSWENGGFMFQFGSQESGRTIVNSGIPYAQRAAVLITTNGVAIIDGENQSVENEAFYKYPSKYEGIESFPAGYGADHSTGDANLSETQVYIKVLNGKVTVTLTKVGEATPFITVEKDITWNKEGTFAFTGFTFESSVTNMVINPLTDAGNKVEPEKPEWEYKPDNSAMNVTWPYDFASDLDENNALRDAINAKFDVYHSYGDTLTKLSLNQIGTKVCDDWNGCEIQLKAMQNGLNLYTKLSDYDNQTMRNSLSLVPKTGSGDQVKVENLEVTFDLKTQLQWSNGGFMFQFRSKDSGRTIAADNTPYAQRAAVLITADGVAVLDGAATSEEYAALYQKPAAATEFTKFPSGYDTGNGNGTSVDMHVYIKVLGDKVTVKITKDGEDTPFVDMEETITWMGEGTVAFTGLLSNNYVSNIVLKALDEDGNMIPIGGGGQTNATTPDWSTKTDGHIAQMGTFDYANNYDFYFTSAAGGTVKENAAAHWALQASTGLLYRVNDLTGTKEVDTDKLSMIHWKDTAVQKLQHFDAIFNVYTDASAKGTFWFTARQTDATKLGQVATNPGAEAPAFLKDQLTVGVTTSGDVIISGGGDGKATTIDGASAGLSTGLHIFRIRVIGDVVEVFVDGVMRGARGIDASVMEEGYICFGVSGATPAMGITSVDISKMEENGLKVDLTTDYKPFNVDSLEPIKVNVNASMDEVRKQLPTKVTIEKEDGTTEVSKVFWVLRNLDLTTEAINVVPGYLENTNGIRAAIKVVVGGYDPENTVKYNFDSATEAELFETYAMPTTHNTNVPPIKTTGTDDNNWYVEDGRLRFKHSSMYMNYDQLAEGKEIAGNRYQDDRTWRLYASNFGIAVLKTKTYKNFILDVDINSNSFWNIVGFGAKATEDPTTNFSIYKNGGYSFHVESGSGKGSVNFWGVNPVSGESMDINGTMSPYIIDGKQHHYRIVVSDGVAYFYLDDIATPFTQKLPASYDGGYIFLALNHENGGFDNLKITDLDAKKVTLTSVVTEMEPLVIDRSKDEILVLKDFITYADADGYQYTLPTTWESDDYRSSYDGTYTFTGSAGAHNLSLAASAIPTTVVENQINGDYDPTTSVKIYFDHVNDLKHFSTYYAKQDGSNWSSYEGNLVKGEPTDFFHTGGGWLSNSYAGTNAAWGYAQKGQYLATLVLDKLTDASGNPIASSWKNYEISFEYEHGTNWWYGYILTGVQDPSKWYAVLENDALTYIPEQGGGVWTWMEREGYINVAGAMDGQESQRWTEEEGVFISNYNQDAPHTFHQKVYNGISLWTAKQYGDETLVSDEYAAGMSAFAEGGYIGLATHGNGYRFKELLITTLDVNGNPVPIANAETGMAPEPMEDTYTGWAPTKEEWFFQWGKEYEGVK